MRIIGYTYNADCHCVDCANQYFDNVIGVVDSEGNPIHPIFDHFEHNIVCAQCGETI